VSGVHDEEIMVGDLDPPGELECVQCGKLSQAIRPSLEHGFFSLPHGWLMCMLEPHGADSYVTLVPACSIKCAWDWHLSSIAIQGRLPS
jgi:hypothetical protein